MLDIFAKILEQFGAFFRVQEQLLSLSSSNPVLAGAVIFIFIVIGANIAITQFNELRTKFFGQWIRNRFAWAGLFAGFCVAALVSTGIVLNLRQAAAPVPVLVVESNAVIGSPLILSWKYDTAEKAGPRFEVQSSRDAAFNEDVKRVGYRNGFSYFVGHVNDELYWRVRAVDAHSHPISAWSRATQIIQFENSLKRIQKTRSVKVYVSDSFNEAFFKFEANDGEGTIKGFDIAVITEIIRRLPDYLHIDGPINFIPVPVRWGDLLEAPKSGRADIIISTISSFPEREEAFHIKFSKAYYCTTQSLIYRLPRQLQSIPQMITRKVVGYQDKTTSQDILDLFSHDVTFSTKSYREAGLMIDAVATHAIDYGLTDTPFARAAQLQYGKDALGVRELTGDDDFPKELDLTRRVENYAIAVRSGETELMDAINQIIDEMRSGKLRELVDESSKEFLAIQKGILNAPGFEQRKDPSQCQVG